MAVLRRSGHTRSGPPKSASLFEVRAMGAHSRRESAGLLMATSGRPRTTASTSCSERPEQIPRTHPSQGSPCSRKLRISSLCRVRYKGPLVNSMSARSAEFVRGSTAFGFGSVSVVRFGIGLVSARLGLGYAVSVLLNQRPKTIITPPPGWPKFARIRA